MSRKINNLIIGLLLISTLGGCSIARKVEAAPPSKVATIYVQRNQNVHMEGLHDEVLAQLRGLGYAVAGFEEARPKEAIHMLTYTANWRWDMAMYLTYFQATLLEGSRVLGRAEYDATMGGWRPDKFGRTAEKIRPLFIDLLQNVERVEASATSMGATTQ